MSDKTIIWTETDEAPALATWSLLPIVQAFTGAAGLAVETRDISLAGRMIAAFPERLTPAQRQTDDLAELGELAKTPLANIIKLPNISASIPQLQDAIRELQAQGYDLPDFPEEPRNDAERDIRSRYAKVLGSAVNPVLREGNSDRRVAAAVKQYARKHPHSMGPWSTESKSHVAHMDGGDFYGSEKSAVIAAAGTVRIELAEDNGNVHVLKDKTAVQADEVIDASTMSCEALRKYYARQIDDARTRGVLPKVIPESSGPMAKNVATCSDQGVADGDRLPPQPGTFVTREPMRREKVPRSPFTRGRPSWRRSALRCVEGGSTS